MKGPDDCDATMSASECLNQIYARSLYDEYSELTREKDKLLCNPPCPCPCPCQWADFRLRFSGRSSTATAQQFNRGERIYEWFQTNESNTNEFHPLTCLSRQCQSIKPFQTQAKEPHRTFYTHNFTAYEPPTSPCNTGTKRYKTKRFQMPRIYMYQHERQKYNRETKVATLPPAKLW